MYPISGLALVAACLFNILLLPQGGGSKPHPAKATVPVKPTAPVKPSAPAPWTITNITNGMTVQGSVTFKIDVEDTRTEYLDLTVEVDEEMTEKGGEVQRDLDNGHMVTSFSLDTDSYSNGWHTIEVIDLKGYRQRRKIRFANDVASFHVTPLFDRKKKAACTIDAKFPKPGQWKVSIQTTGDTPTVVRTYSGNSAVLHLDWAGRNATGSVVPDEYYEVKVSFNNGKEHIRGVNKSTSP